MQILLSNRLFIFVVIEHRIGLCRLCIIHTDFECRTITSTCVTTIISHWDINQMISVMSILVTVSRQIFNRLCTTIRSYFGTVAELHVLSFAITEICMWYHIFQHEPKQLPSTIHQSNKCNNDHSIHTHLVSKTYKIN